MDSATQFVLGAGVSAAILGPRIGIRKAVILGGVYGTLPDLDSFLPAESPVDAFVSHRGATHSLILQALATPIFAEPLIRLFTALRDQRLLTYLGVYLIFATHALIDAITVYGTRLFMPIIDDPVGIGSVFIIDPLYTLPLLIMAVWGLFLGPWRALYGKWLRRVLVATSIYMLISIPLQAYMKDRAISALNAVGVDATADNTLTIPAPFSVLFWKSVTVEEDRYVNFYQPLFADTGHAYAHPRAGAVIPALADNAPFQDLAAFAKGFFSLSEEEGRIHYADLRMGLTPSYAFRFIVAAREDDGSLKPIPPERVREGRGQEGDLDWLLAGLRQSPMLRPAEQSQLLAIIGD